MKSRYHNLLKSLGPGILFASTAIGVSHLVQSTRAGADYGFALLWAILLANLFKYPFFEYGSRYANSKEESLIDGYARLGKGILAMYFIITLISMFFVTAAVGAVTSGFMDNLFGLSSIFGAQSYAGTSIGVFVLCVSILIFGRYRTLDTLIKIIGSVLLISTIVAFVLTLNRGPSADLASVPIPPIFEIGGITFLIALMGWMPTAVDMSTWISLWTLERIKQTGYKPKLKETLFDFNFGYIISALLSVCFVVLGAYLVFGTGKTMPDKSHLFANEVVQLYTESIGEWSYLIIAAAAFSIMFGTCIAVFDGYARAMERTAELLFLSKAKSQEALKDRSFYISTLLILAVGSFAIVFWFSDKLKSLVDLATIISFIIAPVIAIVNFRLVTGKYLNKEDQPKKWLRVLSVMGILFLTGFSLYYLIAVLPNGKP